MKSYKPRISESRARESLTLRGRVFRSKKIIPHRVELIYLPYYFFSIRVKDKKGREREFYAAIDAILGNFSLVEKEVMAPEELEGSEFEPVISLEEAGEKLEKEVRWFLVAKSLQRRQNYVLLSHGQGELAFYPFWLGYYKNRGGAWEFLGIDAVSGVIQGGHGRRLFIHALASTRVKPQEPAAQMDKPT
jgi:hypothetical protein